TVAEPASCVGVTDQQVTTAMGTDEQAAQQRRPVARTPQAGGPVGLETLLVSPVALGCDVGRAATFEQDQALLGRADRPPRPGTTGHLTPRVTRPVAPAVVPRINGMMQQVLQGDTVRATPFELTAVGAVVRPNRHTDVVLDQIVQEPVNAALPLELLE